MKIGIDGKPLTTPFPCGLKTYAQEILLHLAEIDRENIYIIFSPKPIRIPQQQNFLLRIGNGFLPWQIQLPFLVWQEKIDIFHFLQQHGSIFLFHPKIVATIHDLASIWVYPGWRESLFYSILGRYVNLVRSFVLVRSTAFIAVSEATKTELLNLGIKKPIHVVFNGVSPFFKMTKPSPERKHILAMTDFSPRKNIIRTIAAYARLPLALRRKYELKIVVSMTYPEEKILRLAQELGIDKQVTLIEQPSGGKLLQLYNQAVLFAYPSVYEGFGLPILEAMACGCPVITSKAGAPQEIAGKAAVLVNPLSVVEVAQAMLEIIAEKGTAQDLRKLGLSRVKDFSWKESAQKTLAVYEKTYRT